ncbi:hypothetical protein O1Q82_00269 [Lonepinella sp. MS14437]
MLDCFFVNDRVFFYTLDFFEKLSEGKRLLI